MLPQANPGHPSGAGNLSRFRRAPPILILPSVATWDRKDATQANPGPARDHRCEQQKADCLHAGSIPLPSAVKQRPR